MLVVTLTGEAHVNKGPGRPYFNDQMGAAINASTEKTEAFLMGRVLYDEWSGYWGSAPEDLAVPGEPREAAEPFAEFINNTPKVVVSTTLEDQKITVSDDVKTESGQATHTVGSDGVVSEQGSGKVEVSTSGVKVNDGALEVT